MSHIKNIKFLLLILSTVNISAESQCGEWITYKDIKCFKIFESSGLQSFEDAINSCRQQSSDSNLISINSAEEQTFLTNMIFTTNQIVDNVWIGAKYVNSQYKWLNGANLSYTNWAEGYPKNLTDECVEMHSDTDFVGKWYDASCKRKNLLVCEKLPNWSISHIQQTVLSLMDSFEKSELIHKQTETSLMDKITTLEKDKIQSDLIHKQTEANIMDKVSAIEKSELIHKQTEENLQETISNLKQNIIPVGFIYVQFPNEKIPHDIWSWMTWQEITSSYAGLFFRAFGGNSGSFGNTQEANAPRITNFQTQYTSAHNNVGVSWESTINEGGWSNWVWTGSSSGSNIDIRFASSGGEVRPRNTAIRIWKRYA